MIIVVGIITYEQFHLNVINFKVKCSENFRDKRQRHNYILLEV